MVVIKLIAHAHPNIRLKVVAFFEIVHRYKTNTKKQAMKF